MLHSKKNMKQQLQKRTGVKVQKSENTNRSSIRTSHGSELCFKNQERLEEKKKLKSIGDQKKHWTGQRNINGNYEHIWYDKVCNAGYYSEWTSKNTQKLFL